MCDSLTIYTGLLVLISLFLVLVFFACLIAFEWGVTNGRMRELLAQEQILIDYRRSIENV